MLKEEVEEMKATLSCTEEGRARASAHSKHVVSQKAQERLLNSARILTGICSLTVSSVFIITEKKCSLPFTVFVSLFPLSQSGERLISVAYLVCSFSLQEKENQSLIAKIASLQEEVPSGR